jgi:HSP20 family molecular chaperone IbpA
MTQMLYTPYERLFRDIMKEFDYENVLSDNSYMTYITKQSYNIEMPLIGVQKEELKIRAEDGFLFVQAKPAKTSKFVKETNIKFSLKEDADLENVTAKLENGLLLVTIPRIVPEKKSHNIKIN